MRRVEVSVRTLTRSDREACTEVKRWEWASWLYKEAVELVESPTKSYPPCRWVLTWENTIGPQELVELGT